MRFLTQKNRSILREMVSTDFKVRYQGSVLGYAWSVLKPLFLFAILYIVFVKFLGVGKGIPHYGVALLFGIVLWSFFAEATVTGMNAIVNRADLIKKISIPRYLVVVSSVSSAFINLIINLLVVLLFAIIDGVDPLKTWLLIPLFVIELLAFALALSFFLSALYVKYRDAAYIWEVLLQAAFYATPILYPLSYVADKYHKLIMLNPMAQIIQDSRWAFISHDTLSSWKVLGSPLLFVPPLIIIVVIVLASKYFKSQARDFAENI
ncbi:MAG: type transport system permease protein [Patescibacteria group bacterium]|nr:type transport system permease protein [Patescibacteria group bacterium]